MRQSKGVLTKEKILLEATRLVQRKGFEGTSICDLMEATGLKKGSLYFHFSDKNELTYAVLEKARTEFLEFLDSSLTGRTAGESLDNFFKKVLGKHRSTKFVGGCIFGNSALEMSDKDKQVAVFIDRVFGEWIERVRVAVRSAQSSGQIRCDLSAEAMARHIVMTIEGGIMLARLEKSEKPLKDCLNSLRTLIELEK
ncbi:MAG: TetR/AcrR family transcriptional regulator [Candidatus Tectomicrobia bacterium]|uniref:TetR/AcrR family transcriptional regulator n=1 Tax=Tectimicrobiota bacterium TaxID=2528274 RepID=A0A932M286_UNCTE|nr:TetR/AcrR family transcriptional regulator [Candidatus Tectomicrobia bacterium]